MVSNEMHRFLHSNSHFVRRKCFSDIQRHEDILWNWWSLTCHYFPVCKGAWKFLRCSECFWRLHYQCFESCWPTSECFNGGECWIEELISENMRLSLGDIKELISVNHDLVRWILKWLHQLLIQFDNALTHVAKKGIVDKVRNQTLW